MVFEINLEVIFDTSLKMFKIGFFTKNKYN